MTNFPLVSVVVTLYNYEDFISDCIKSILRQDYPNLEVIIVDDASSDKSYKKAKKFVGDRVRLIKHKKNFGYSVAKNTGIEASKGDYVMLLDADDMMTTRSIFCRIQAALSNKVEFVHADAIAIYDNMTLDQCRQLNTLTLPKYGEKSRIEARLPSLQHFPTPYEIHAQTVMVHRNLYKKFGLYDEKLRSRSDREMWWRFFGQSEKDQAKIKVVHINEYVAYYRYHKKSMTRFRVKNPDYNKAMRKIAENVYAKRRKGINENNTKFLKD